MRRRTAFWLVGTTAMLGMVLVSPPASTWEGERGRGYSPAYLGQPVYTHSPPAVVYPGPPIYMYSSVPPEGGGHAARRAFGQPAYGGYYRARVNVLRGPRWDYSAAYYSSPPVARVFEARKSRRARAGRFCPPHRAYIRGPIVRMPR